jgi:hypothetical protein
LASSSAIVGASRRSARISAWHRAVFSPARPTTGRLHRRQRDGASVKGFTVGEGKSGTMKDGGRGNANTAVGSRIRPNAMSALTGSDESELIIRTANRLSQSRKILAGAPDDEQARIAGSNTARVYNLTRG